MSENHNRMQAAASPTISDTKGKGKQKEADIPAHASDLHADTPEDTWGEYPLEAFPLPPSDGFWHVWEAKDDGPIPATIPNTDASLKFNTPLHPPLIALTFPPSTALANDPTWYAKMFTDVHRHRDHLNSQLELAQTDAASALAEVTLAQIELSAELDQMQSFLNRVAHVAGKSFVRKLLNGVKWVLENGEDAADDDSEEERPNADDDDSSDDDNSVEEDQTDAKNGKPSGSSDDESSSDEQRSDNENSGDDADAKSRGGSENGSHNRACEEEKSSTFNSAQNHHETCGGGEDAKSLGSSQSLSPIPEDSSRKRSREVDEDEEASSPNISPRKKFKGDNFAESSPLSTRHYAGAGSDDDDAPPSQHVWCPEDDEIDPEPNSEEEYEVEDSLLLVESDPVTPPLAGPSMPRSLVEVSRDPYRLRQNSRGEPELYIPSRR